VQDARARGAGEARGVSDRLRLAPGSAPIRQNLEILLHTRDAAG